MVFGDLFSLKVMLIKALVFIKKIEGSQTTHKMLLVAGYIPPLVLYIIHQILSLCLC